MTVSGKIDLNDHICSPIVDVDIKIDVEIGGDSENKEELDFTHTLNVNDYEDIRNIEVDLDFEFDDIVDQIADKELLEELGERNLIPKSKEVYNNLDFSTEKKRFMCDLMNLSYCLTTKQILTAIKNEIT